MYFLTSENLSFSVFQFQVLRPLLLGLNICLTLTTHTTESENNANVTKLQVCHCQSSQYLTHTHSTHTLRKETTRDDGNRAGA